MGPNGVWGNLGVASSALVTGLVGQYLGWRWAFFIPGVVTILTGVAFMRSVVHEDRSGFKQAAAQARIAKNDMWRVIVSLLIVVVAISTTFNAVTVALPKLFAERLTDLTKSPALLGVIAAGVYVLGAMMQYTIGKLIDRHSRLFHPNRPVFQAGWDCVRLRLSSRTGSLFDVRLCIWRTYS